MSKSSVLRLLASCILSFTFLACQPPAGEGVQGSGDGASTGEDVAFGGPALPFCSEVSGAAECLPGNAELLSVSPNKSSIKQSSDYSSVNITGDCNSGGFSEAEVIAETDDSAVTSTGKCVNGKFVLSLSMENMGQSRREYRLSIEGIDIKNGSRRIVESVNQRPEIVSISRNTSN